MYDHINLYNIKQTTMRRIKLKARCAGGSLITKYKYYRVFTNYIYNLPFVGSPLIRPARLVIAR